MKVSDLNEELMNELDMQDVKDGAKKVIDGAKETYTKVKKVLKDEYRDNVEAFKIFIKKFKGKEQVTDEQFKNALNQVFKDNVKLLAIAGIGATPGSAVTLPLAMKIAKKFGINLVPSKTF